MSEIDTAVTETVETIDTSGHEEFPPNHPLVRTLEKLRMETKDLRGKAKVGDEAIRRLAEIEESQKTETQRAAERAAEAERELANVRLEAARYRVAVRMGLPETLAKRLSGMTEEEMTADAVDLLALLPRKEEVEDKTDLPNRPKEALKSGSTGADEEGPSQLTREDIKGWPADKIEEARLAHRLDRLLGIIK